MVYILSPEEVAKRNKEKADFQNYNISGKSSIDIIRERGGNKIAHMLKNHPYADEDDITAFLNDNWKLSDEDTSRIFNPGKNFSGIFSVNDDKLTNDFTNWYKHNRNKKWYAEKHKK